MSPGSSTSLPPPSPGQAELPRPALLTQLRRAIRKLERPGVRFDGEAPIGRFGIAPLDEALGGGLAIHALHEIVAAREPEIAAATVFGLAVTSLSRRPPTVWITESRTERESGRLYGPGLDSMGFSPERLVVVTTTRAEQVLWAMEEALHCAAVGAVIGELRAPRLDDVAGRRLSLAASERGALALLLRPTPGDSAATAATRWIVESAPAGSAHGIGPPRLAVDLVRNRYGRLGSWVLEWNCVEQRLHLASTQPQPVVSSFPDRSVAPRLVG